MVNLCVAEIQRVSKEILIKNGVPENQAEIVANTIVDAHKKEKHTHGMGRLPIYVRKINSGQMEAETRVDIIRDQPVMKLVDAHNGFGQVAAYEGMKLCNEMAKRFGVGIVGVKDSNSFGAAGYYGEIAAKEGLIGMVLGNSAAALTPEGGKKAVFGTNPICFSFPGTESLPYIVLDMACSVAARGKVRLAAKNGEKIPLTWAKDSEGNPTDDPNEAIKGSMNAIGGYKGVGLAMVVDILAGMITGSAFADELKPLNTPEGYSRYGHFLCAINPLFFIEENEYKERVEHLVKCIKESGDTGEILLPGENAYRNSQKNKINVQVKETIVNDVNQLADRFGVKGFKL